MIVDTVRGDVFKSPHKYIAFAVNTEGYNDAGFAGAVSSRYWPELANTGKKQLGDVLRNTADKKTFYAVVCHSLEAKDGWHYAATIVEKCLNKVEVPDSETIAVVLMGSGMVGQLGGADIFAILGGIARSKKRVAVYTL